MVALDDVVPGARFRGMVAEGPVSIVRAQPLGGAAVNVLFEIEATGEVERRVLYHDDLASLALLPDESAWVFDADGERFRLVMEAARLRLAYLFDPQLAVSVSRVEPLPHQLAAVYDVMLPRRPLRFLLADDPGAGKTIMTGLLIKELLLRADIERCLIVVPAALDVQWQDELRDKFDLHFTLLGRDQIEGAMGNAFADHDLIIGRIDLLKQDEHLDRLQATQWDLVVIDEAHKLGATYLPGPNEVKETARYRLGRVLGERARHFLLLTATPHRGKQADFQLLLRLLDPDRFAGKPRADASATATQDAVGDLMRRMLKEDLVDFDGCLLFPERFAQTVAYTLSEPEIALYESVTRYVREEMTRADRIAERGGGEGKRRRAVVGFALTTLQRRLASSPEAILRSLERRRARLAATLADHQDDAMHQNVDRQRNNAADSERLRFDLDLGVRTRGLKIAVGELELDLEERPESELEEIVDRASAAGSLTELEREVMLLHQLEHQARQLREAGVDAKWRQLSDLLDDPQMFDAEGRREKLVIFTEHRDTLDYLVSRLRTRLNRDEDVALIHGGLDRAERHREQSRFVGDDPALPEASVLVATDAAGEGINLQVAHLMINYDLPWNPNRLEQRFGRIHRFGQRHACYNWNLVARNTREGDVYRTLLDKMDEARQALGGKVFDVLGQLFADRPLRDLLLEAIRQENSSAVAQIERDVELLASLDRYRELVARHALAKVELEPDQVQAIRAERERAEDSRLVPYFIESFFVAAFRELGGTIEEREPGRYAVPAVPLDLRHRGKGVGPSIADRYGRVCFDKSRMHVTFTETEDGHERTSRHNSTVQEATLIAPGQPLFDLTADLLRERYGDILRRGAVLVDPRPSAETVRVMVCIEIAIADARLDPTGKRSLAGSELRFIEVDAAGNARDAGVAPHLDYRPLDEAERAAVSPLLTERWIAAAPGVAEAHVAAHLLLLLRQQVKREREDALRRTREAIDARLTEELLRLSQDIADLARQEREGRQPKMNVDRARRQYDELQERWRRRLEEIDRHLQLAALPPRVVAATIVVPDGLLADWRGDGEEAERTTETRRIEDLAMHEVLDRERAAGYLARDVSDENRGYDIESLHPTSGERRLIEVKGRDVRGETVMLTRNEYLCALNHRADYVLAIVQIDGEAVCNYHAIPDPLGRTTEEGLPFGLEASTFAIADLVRGIPAS